MGYGSCLIASTVARHALGSASDFFPQFAGPLCPALRSISVRKSDLLYHAQLCVDEGSTFRLHQQVGLVQRFGWSNRQSLFRIVKGIDLLA